MSSPNEAINERSPLLAPQQTNQDQDVEANASIPFPSQRDPRRPLRPSDFTRQRVASKWNSWFNKNRGLLLVLLAQLFYSSVPKNQVEEKREKLPFLTLSLLSFLLRTMALFYKLLNSLPPSDGQVIGVGVSLKSPEALHIEIFFSSFLLSLSRSSSFEWASHTLGVYSSFSLQKHLIPS